tara:strand:+ start:1417 stop:2385 length:969 start_codon:yes stop_codon:yes gene_type:complete
MLLTEVYVPDNLTILEESKKKGTMIIEGIFQLAETPNNNNRVYSQTILENQSKKLQDMIDERRLCGELDHPSNDTVKLSNASHLITGLWMEGKEMKGRAEILNTPAGMTAQALIKGGVKIGISSRGLGTLSEGEGDTKKVNEDFNLITFDLVADPSTKGAYPQLTESVMNEICEGISCVKRDVNKKVGEKVFLTLLENKLREEEQLGLFPKGPIDPHKDTGQEVDTPEARKAADDARRREAAKKKPTKQDSSVDVRRGFKKALYEDQRDPKETKKSEEVRHYLRTGEPMPGSEAAKKAEEAENARKRAERVYARIQRIKGNT